MSTGSTRAARTAPDRPRGRVPARKGARASSLPAAAKRVRRGGATSWCASTAARSHAKDLEASICETSMDAVTKARDAEPCRTTISFRH